MALPTLEKTWQFNVNQVTATSGVHETDVDTMILKLKNSLIGFASTPWTVVSSSNGVTFGASDFWSTIADLVHANSGAHSWIVLKQTGCGGQGNFQICLDLLSSSVNTYNIAFSLNAGFIGGSVSARPTASDESVNTGAAFAANIPEQNVLHVMQTSDGTSTRVIVASSGVVRCTWFIETQADCLASPNSAAFYVSSGVLTTVLTASAAFNGRNASLAYQAYLTGEMAANTLICNLNAGAQNQFVNAYQLCPIGLYSNTATKLGRVGRLVDLWWGSSAIALGSTYPLTGDTREFVQFGAVVYPWNGSIPVIN
jgi:hypothetical protein